MKVSDPTSKHMLTSWGRFDREMYGVPPRAFGFIDDTGEVNRFAARYRLAKSFSTVTFETYSKSTESGYEGLLRLFFAWSAFEQYLKISKRKQNNIDDILSRYNMTKFVEKIRSMDEGNKYFKFIAARTDKAHREQLERYFKKRKFNVTYLASSIRHIFVHGPLTPNADQTPPEKAKSICNYLSKFLLHVLDLEFTRHADEFDEMMEEYYRQL